jgi:hypothetical protein
VTAQFRYGTGAVFINAIAAVPALSRGQSRRSRLNSTRSASSLRCRMLPAKNTKAVVQGRSYLKQAGNLAVAPMRMDRRPQAYRLTRLRRALVIDARESHVGRTSDSSSHLPFLASRSMTSPCSGLFCRGPHGQPDSLAVLEARGTSSLWKRNARPVSAAAPCAAASRNLSPSLYPIPHERRTLPLQCPSHGAMVS